ncbi:MAG: hypothetical protein IKH46_10835, partial [Lachnospiraceae bacterium]|nr:hypothetical protein [Lachnospiraceae bacterium]
MHTSSKSYKSGIIKQSVKSVFIISLLYFFVFNLFFQSIYVKAGDTSYAPGGKMYVFDKDSKYEISTSGGTTISGSNTIGSFSISGDLTEQNGGGILDSYDVKNGNIAFSYNVRSSSLSAGDKDWHLYKDTKKTVDDIELEKQIGKGVIIVETSLDNANWVTDVVITNAFDTSGGALRNPIYNTKDIQLVNGCYYRVIIAYEQERINEPDGIFDKKKEYRKCAEVYEFYAINKTESSLAASPSDTPRLEYSDFINTGKENNGYSGNEAVGNKDPHYGWKIGRFIVNGYTSEVKLDGNSVFLKNVGDRVTLWFRLEQNINALNGNDKLSIAMDDNAHDQYFQIQNTYFKRGALIIRYKDREGVYSDPIIYTDFLAANATTGANTKVELFEEGDYEVSLDYEINNATQLIPSVSDYKIFFTFSIRNGNSMVYPFDAVTGAELSDRSVTPNGFRLDMAKSRYLSINVKREVFAQGPSGLTSDVRFNRPAKDGETYSEEGVYTFTVKNLY